MLPVNLRQEYGQENVLFHPDASTNKRTRSSLLGVRVFVWSVKCENLY